MTCKGRWKVNEVADTGVTHPSKGKRALDILISTVTTLVLSPILAVGWLFSGRSFKRTPRLGQRCVLFEELSFHTDRGWGGRVLNRLHLGRLPVLLNIVRGDMSFVGPLPFSPENVTLHDAEGSKRYQVRPGLISLWWIRRRANIDYGSELEADIEYVNNHGIRVDIGILLRTVPAILYGGRALSCHGKMAILGIPVSNCTMTEAIETIVDWVHGTSARQICFVNADCANIAYRNEAYLDVLKGADLCLADGIGIKLGAKILSQDIVQNVNGTDMFPRLCERLSGTDTKVFLLGARPEVVEGVAEWIRDHYPQLHLCGWQHGYFELEKEPEIVQRIKHCGTHLLLVAFGAPKQDLWIREHLKETGVKVATGVGGLFDFYSGRIQRAPLWMREIGMEWFYRLIQEPGRLWKRYLIGNGLFLWRVLKERLFQEHR
jgi:N-acetylglucosaminyldiphosphoundecaprenol N-acetyl-beta-D-mannosaminyltransferase